MSLCQVCGEPGASLHFGALSCRACAAFFRRKVAANQKFQKLCEGKCPLQNQYLRKICVGCRFEKCLKVGMSKTAVLSRLPLPFQSSRTILEQLKEAFLKLQHARSVAFRRKTPQLMNYQQVYAMLRIDIQLVQQNFLPFFRSQEPREEKSQKLLIDSFMVPFIMFDGGFRSQHSDLMIFASGDYMNFSKLELYYRSLEDVDDKNAQFSKSIFEPYWKMNKLSIRNHMKEVQLDLSEFLLLSALVYWDFGLPEQSDECIEVCRRKREEVIMELTKYEKKERRGGEDSMRICEIMMVLQALQKSLNAMREFKEISEMYNVNSGCPLFDISM